MQRFSNLNPSAAGSTEKSYYGNYLGIVVQNNDPDKQGKVKIFVPHISPTVYKNWVESKEDKKFKFIGKNINSDLTDVIDDLKEILPWAECAAPLVGPSSAGRYNAHQELGTISDSARLEELDKKENIDDKYNFSLNVDGIGESPARVYEVDELRLQDAFNDSVANKTNKINKYGANYTPSSYSNCPKGSFGIPNVGAHVWLFFKEGSPMHPIYFATSFGQEDWKAIYDIQDDEGIDYPGAFENKSKKDDPGYNHNTETYRNKYVLNQKGGTLEIVNTDNKELLKFTHFKGSFLEFNNDTTIQLAAGNEQKLVREDQFHTIKGFKNQWVERDYDLLVRGDFYTKIGTFNTEQFQAWKEIIDGIADYKQLFEIQRANRFESGNEFIKRVSIYQDKKTTADNPFGGSWPKGKEGHAKCPICSHDQRAKIWKFNNVFQEYTQVNNAAPSGGSSSYGGGGFSSGSEGSGTLVNNWLGGGDSSYSGDDSDNFNAITSTENDYPSLILPAGGRTNFLQSGNCPICGGTGISPSSQGGDFIVDERKVTKVQEELQDKIIDLLEIEKKLGLGGSSITNITKHKIENIGLIMNDLPSLRIDNIGKMVPNELKVFSQGVVTGQKESCLVEYVHVDDLPGGSCNLNVCNRYNVQVGAGGISMKSFGPVDISGTITNIAGEQINIASDNEINICTNGRLNVIADILSIRQKKYGQVLVDSNLGVSQNVIVGGAMHVEGELSCHHITAPVEYQQTEQVRLAVKAVSGVQFNIELGGFSTDHGGGILPGSGWVKFESAHEMAWTDPHSHQFRNLPLTLTDTNDQVRDRGKLCELPVKATARPVVHEKKDENQVYKDT